MFLPPPIALRNGGLPIRRADRGRASPRGRDAANSEKTPVRDISAQRRSRERRLCRAHRIRQNRADGRYDRATCRCRASSPPPFAGQNLAPLPPQRSLRLGAFNSPAVFPRRRRWPLTRAPGAAIPLLLARSNPWSSAAAGPRAASLHTFRYAHLRPRARQRTHFVKRSSAQVALVSSCGVEAALAISRPV